MNLWELERRKLLDEVKITINEFTSDFEVKVNGKTVFNDKSWFINYQQMIDILEKLKVELDVEWV